MAISTMTKAGEGKGSGTPTCPNFEPADVVGPFATPFLGPVQPVFLVAERLVKQRE